MHKQINLQKVSVGIYNRLTGNMHPKFDEPNVVEQRRKMLIKEISPARVVRIKAQGLDGVVGRKFSRQWNEIECDGLITHDSSLALVLMPADCIPLVVYSTQTNLFGLIHVGRKGAALGIHQKAITYIHETYKEGISNLRFFLGPSIHQESYFFMNEEIEQLHDPLWREFISRRNDVYYIDLVGFTMQGLIGLGVPREHITCSEVDTGSDLEYFSHARSKRSDEPEGRNTVVVFKGEKQKNHE